MGIEPEIGIDCESYMIRWLTKKGVRNLMEGVIGIELMVQSSYSCNFVCNDNGSFRSEEEALIERKYVLSYN